MTTPPIEERPHISWYTQLPPFNPDSYIPIEFAHWTIEEIEKEDPSSFGGSSSYTVIRVTNFFDPLRTLAKNIPVTKHIVYNARDKLELYTRFLRQYLAKSPERKRIREDDCDGKERDYDVVPFGVEHRRRLVRDLITILEGTYHRLIYIEKLYDETVMPSQPRFDHMVHESIVKEIIEGFIVPVPYEREPEPDPSSVWASAVSTALKSFITSTSDFLVEKEPSKDGSPSLFSDHCNQPPSQPLTDEFHP